MSATPDGYTVADHFTGKDSVVRKIYDGLLAALRSVGPIREEPKKTSIHLVRSSALAGVETRRNYLLLNIKADGPIDSPRIDKSEQLSARRYHHRLKLSSPADVDADVQSWLKAAYELS